MTYPNAALIHLYSYAEKKIRAGAPANGIALGIAPIETPEGNGFIIQPSHLRMPVLAIRDLLGRAFGHASTFPSFSLKVLQAKTDEHLILRSTGIEMAVPERDLSRNDAEERIFDWVLDASRYIAPAAKPAPQVKNTLDFKG